VVHETRFDDHKTSDYYQNLHHSDESRMNSIDDGDRGETVYFACSILYVNVSSQCNDSRVKARIGDIGVPSRKNACGRGSAVDGSPGPVETCLE
jgi:hypothetical protein